MPPHPSKRFAIVCPELAKFWSPLNDKSPNDVGYSSVYEAWWEVPGFSEPFQEKVRSVYKKGYAAPLQRPKHAIADEPGLADEFADDNPLPATFVGRSRKDHFNWVCRDCGTPWSAAPFTRWNGLHGCPKCTEMAKEEERAAKVAQRTYRQRIKDERKKLRNLKFRLRKVHTQLKIEKKRRDNAESAERRRLQRLKDTKSSLLHVRPDVAAELVGVDPSTVSAYSGIKQRWRGSNCGHEWKAKVNDRVSKNSGCPVCAGRTILPGTNDLLTLFPAMAAEWSKRNERSVDTVSPGSNTKFWWTCQQCGHEWKAQPNARCYFRNRGCPACFKSGRSRSEEELFNYVAGRLEGHANVQRHVTGLLGGNKEVDVFVPELNVAFEFNGLYWHKEDRVGRTYHHDKVMEARERGIRLVHIWEDDWNNRRRITERMIDVALGVDERDRVGARECEVEANVAPTEVREFLARNHLLGAPRALSHTWGLRYGDELVAVLIALRRDDGYEITRYATSKRVQGGFTRLLARLEQLLAEEGGGTVTSFSDNAHSVGDLYALAGFVRDGDVAPDYMYAAKDKERRHKCYYCKSKFRTNPNLAYEEGLTERELAELNGLFRVYDAGKVRWKKQVKAN